MINPIKSTPVALPADLTTNELPASITRASVPIPPSENTHKAGLATGRHTHNDLDGSHDTPLEKTLEQLNESMKAWSTGMRFDIDEDAQRIVVSIIDSTTGEVLRSVPSEAVIRIAKMIAQLQGNAIDTRA